MTILLVLVNIKYIVQKMSLFQELIVHKYNIYHDDSNTVMNNNISKVSNT